MVKCRKAIITNDSERPKVWTVEMARGQKLERQNFERVRGNSVVGELLGVGVKIWNDEM